MVTEMQFIELKMDLSVMIALDKDISQIHSGYGVFCKRNNSILVVPFQGPLEQSDYQRWEKLQILYQTRFHPIRLIHPL